MIRHQSQQHAPCFPTLHPSKDMNPWWDCARFYGFYGFSRHRFPKSWGAWEKQLDQDPPQDPSGKPDRQGTITPTSNTEPNKMASTGGVHRFTSRAAKTIVISSRPWRMSQDRWPRCTALVWKSSWKSRDFTMKHGKVSLARTVGACWSEYIHVICIYIYIY